MEQQYRECRESSGLTAQEAATRIGVSISTLFSWERGVTSPDSPRIISLCDLYKVSPNKLLGYPGAH